MHFNHEFHSDKLPIILPPLTKIILTRKFSSIPLETRKKSKVKIKHASLPTHLYPQQYTTRIHEKKKNLLK